MEILDHLDQTVNLVLKVDLVTQDWTSLQALQDRKDLPAIRDLQDSRDNRDRRELPEPVAHRTHGFEAHLDHQDLKDQ